MSLPQLKYCPGTLAEGFDTYSPTCLRNLFNGKKVSHVLPFESPQKSEKDIAVVAEQFPSILLEAGKEMDPSKVAAYIFTLAKTFN